MKRVFLYLVLVCTSFNCVGISKELHPLMVTSRQQRNLEALSSMYGYARYFYPNSQLDKVDWHGFLMNVLPSVLEVSDDDELIPVLRKEFALFMDNFYISSQDTDRDTMSTSSTPDTVQYYYVKENKMIPSVKMIPLISNIRKVKKGEKGLPVLDSLYCFPLAEDLYIHYPLALKALPQENKNLPSFIKKNRLKWNRSIITNPYFRIANAIIGDNFIKHFYAYYQEDGLDLIWESECRNYLKEVAECRTEQSYIECSKKHYAAVKDSHLYIWNSYSKPHSLFGRLIRIYYPKLELAVIEDQICVMGCDSAEIDMVQGDIIKEINSIPADQVLNEKMKYVSASTLLSAKEKACAILLNSFRKDSIISLTVCRDEELLHIPVCTSTIEMGWTTPDNSPYISKLPDGLWKVNLCSEQASYKEFASYLPEFKHSNGIVFDMRGYLNSAVLPILSHFIDSFITVGPIETPVYYYPNHQLPQYIIEKESQWGIYPSFISAEYHKKMGYEIPKKVRLNVPIAFLTNYKAISFSETVLEMIKHYKIGPIVGEPTAGTNGDIISASLPAMNYYVTAHKFKNHDGSQHHGIGILPDYYVSPTVKGIRENKDEALEKAIRLIKK